MGPGRVFLSEGCEDDVAGAREASESEITEDGDGRGASTIFEASARRPSWPGRGYPQVTTKIPAPRVPE